MSEQVSRFVVFQPSPTLRVEDKLKNSSLTHGLKLYHQWQLYLCVSVFQQGTLLLI